jgi:polyketide synthase Type III
MLGIEDPRLRALFCASHIMSRRLAEMGEDQKVEKVTQGYLLAKHLRWAKEMGATAVPIALAAAGARLEDVAYLCVCTTTGFLSPGLSAHLTEHLKLSCFVQRADIVGMGCHAGINGLRTAGQWAEANPGQIALLVCVEVCSAGYMWDKEDPQMSVALTNSLFGDGCAACVLRCPVDSSNMRLLKGNGALQPSIYGYEAMLLPGTLDALCYNFDDVRSKFSFVIQPAVPYLIGLEIPVMVHRLLERFKLKKSDISHWVIHSGGKKARCCIVRALGSVTAQYPGLSLPGYRLSWLLAAHLRNRDAPPG